MKRAKKQKTEAKYTKDLLTYLQVAETRDDLSIDIFTFIGRPKWSVARREKLDDREIKITYEGDNLEVLLKKVLF